MGGKEGGMVIIFILGGSYVFKGFLNGSLLKMIESKERMNYWILWMLVLKILEDEITFF